MRYAFIYCLKINASEIRYLVFRARLAQSVEHETLNLRVVGSSPTLGALLLKIIINRMTLEAYEQSYQHSDLIPDIISLLLHMSPWRNWLARSAVNRKVGGSSPPGDGCF